MVTLAIGTPCHQRTLADHPPDGDAGRGQTGVCPPSDYFCLRRGPGIGRRCFPYSPEMIRLLASRPEFVAAAVVVPLLTFRKHCRGSPPSPRPASHLETSPASAPSPRLPPRRSISGWVSASFPILEFWERASGALASFVGLEQPQSVISRRSFTGCSSTCGDLLHSLLLGGVLGAVATNFIRGESEPADFVAVKRPLGRCLPGAFVGNRFPHAGGTPNSDWICDGRSGFDDRGRLLWLRATNQWSFRHSPVWTSHVRHLRSL